MLNGRRSPLAMWTLFRNSLCLSKEFSVTLKRPGFALREKILCTRRNRSALPSRHHLGQIIHHLCSVDRLLCIDIDLWHVASTNTHCPTELKALRSYNQCRGTWTTCIQNVFCHVHVCSCLPLITALPGNPQSQLVSHPSSLCGSDLQSF